MFSSTEIIGIVACAVVAIAVAFFVMRLDSAIVSASDAEEDAPETPDPTASVPAAPAAAALRAPYTGGKKLSRRQRRGRSHS